MLPDEVSAALQGIGNSPGLCAGGVSVELLHDESLAGLARLWQRLHACLRLRWRLCVGQRCWTVCGARHKHAQWSFCTRAALQAASGLGLTLQLPSCATHVHAVSQALATALDCVRGASHGRSVELLRKESLAGCIWLRTDAAAAVRRDSYTCYLTGHWQLRWTACVGRLRGVLWSCCARRAWQAWRQQQLISMQWQLYLAQSLTAVLPL